MVRVTSDVARLRKVIVHRPGASLARMLPQHIEPTSPDYLLFDDLVHVPQAQEEHAQLRAVLGASAEVGCLEDMIVEVLEDATARRQLIDDVARIEDLPGAVVRRMEGLDPEDLIYAVAVGSWSRDFGDRGFMAPLPNLIFARDLAAVVGDMVIVGNASKRARRRETAITWALVDHHPWFKGAQISTLSRRVWQSGGSFPLTIEGGDVLVMSDTLAVIGVSERTSWSMVVYLGQELVQQGFTRVLVVEMAKQRSSMHLDTVFTIVDYDTAVIYPPLLERGGPEEVHVTRLYVEGEALAVEPVGGNLLEALAAEGHPLEPVFCGGGHPLYARREQWTDGSNYVAISPGVVVGYARNERTAAAMSRAGFRVLDADGFLREFKRDFGEDYDELVGSGRRYAVQITGHELSRGRGGPRCLTMPVLRG